jgi:hypothetical protein
MRLSVDFDCFEIDACVNNPCETNSSCTDLPPPALNSPADRACACRTGYRAAPELGVDVCLEINACDRFSCDINATCIDHIPPALDALTDRTCLCNVGYTGNGEVCVSLASLIVNKMANATTAVASSSPPPEPAVIAIVATIVSITVIAVICAVVIYLRRQYKQANPYHKLPKVVHYHHHHYHQPDGTVQVQSEQGFGMANPAYVSTVHSSRPYTGYADVRPNF